LTWLVLIARSKAVPILEKDVSDFVQLPLVVSSVFIQQGIGCVGAAMSSSPV
jgi:hypothetical protein